MTHIAIYFIFLVNLCPKSATGFVENWCQNAILDDKFVCEIYFEDMSSVTEGSKDSVELKYSNHFMHEFMNGTEDGILMDFDDALSSGFLDQIIIGFDLNDVVVLLPDLRSLTMSQIKTILMSDSRVSFQTFAAVSKGNHHLDESTGLLVIGQPSGPQIQNLFQRHPHATWFIGNIDELQFMPLLSVDSNVFRYQMTNQKGIRLEEMYHKPNGDLVKKPWGYWNLNLGLLHVQSQKWDRRKDMTGVVIKATTIQNPPFIWIDQGNAHVTINGFLADIWSILKEKLNFTDTIIPTIDGQYGTLTKNGTWNGMIGMLERNEVDIAVADLTLSDKRAEVTNFTIPIQAIYVKVFFKTPGVDSNDWYLFVKLFRPELWLTLVGILLPLACIFNFMIAGTDNLQGLALFSGIISGQGSYLETNAKVPRIILITLLFSGLILNAAFSANLTSNLFIKKIKLPFDDLKSLYHQSDYKVGSIPGTLWHAVFSLAHEGSEEKLLYHERFNEVASVQKAIEAMTTDDKFAFVWDEESIYSMIPNSCHFQSIMYRKKDNTFYMRQGYPYQQIINNQLRVLKESGQLNKLWNKWKPWRESNCFPIKSEAVPFGKMIGPLSLFTMSFILSFVTYIIETLFYKAMKCISRL